MDRSKDVFVLFHDPVEDDSEKALSFLESLAPLLPEIFFGSFDAILNETRVIKPRKLPMMVLYPKDNKMGVTYHGALEIAEIQQWINSKLV